MVEVDVHSMNVGSHYCGSRIRSQVFSIPVTQLCRWDEGVEVENVVGAGPAARMIWLLCSFAPNLPVSDARTALEGLALLLAGFAVAKVRRSAISPKTMQRWSEDMDSESSFTELDIKGATDQVKRWG